MIINCFTELINVTESINPCTRSSKDFFVKPVEQDESFSTDIVTTIARSLRKIQGCCSSLSPLLKLDNLKMIMDVMRLSIGATIPLSPRYSYPNSTQDTKLLDALFPLDKLTVHLRNRYIVFQLLCIPILTPPKRVCTN